MVFDQKNVISISDFSKDDIEYILRLSEKMEPIARSKKRSNVLSGKILGMLFYEPSTRTRLSFEAAMKRLGGSTIGFAEANVSSATKGENLTDTVKIVGEYSDAIVIRHNMEGTARFVSNVVDVPVINAGDGAPILFCVSLSNPFRPFPPSLRAGCNNRGTPPGGPSRSPGLCICPSCAPAPP